LTNFNGDHYILLSSGSFEGSFFMKKNQKTILKVKELEKSFELKKILNNIQFERKNK
jgi:hypothetical protein